MLISSWLTGNDLSVQKAYILSKGYTVIIHGSVSIHAWTETIEEVSGELVGSMNGDGSANLQSIRIVMEVRSIKSDMGSVMNSKTFKALKADADPEITFLLAIPAKLSQISPGGKAVSLKGSLTLAGVTHPVIMVIKSFKVVKDTMTFEGEQTIKMTDFGVKPPSALFGAMKTAPEITINFKTDFTVKQK